MTENCQGVEFVTEIVHDVVSMTSQLLPGGLEVTTYLTPVDGSGRHETMRAPTPGVARTSVGRASVLIDGADSGPRPRLFVALTVQAYVLVVVSPVTVMGLTTAVPILADPPLDGAHMAV